MQQDDERIDQSVAQSRSTSVMMWVAAAFLLMCIGAFFVWLTSFTGIDLHYALLVGIAMTVVVIGAYLVGLYMVNQRENARRNRL